MNVSLFQAAKVTISLFLSEKHICTMCFIVTNKGLFAGSALDYNFLGVRHEYHKNFYGRKVESQHIASGDTCLHIFYEPKTRKLQLK